MAAASAPRTSHSGSPERDRARRKGSGRTDAGTDEKEVAKNSSDRGGKRRQPIVSGEVLTVGARLPFLKTSLTEISPGALGDP
jgi:hypothetical protein